MLLAEGVSIGVLLLFAMAAILRAILGGPPAPGRGTTEAWVGLSTALLMVLAVGVILAMIWTEWSTFYRVLLALATLLIAFVAASAEWTRAALRTVGFLAVVAIGLLLVTIGHAHLADQASSSVRAEVRAVQNRVAVLSNLLSEQPAATGDTDRPFTEVVEEAIECVTAHIDEGDAGEDCEDDYAGATVGVALDQMRAELAKFQADVVAGIGSETAAEAVNATFEPIPEASAQAASASIADALEAGAEAFVADIPAQDDDPSITFEVGTWIVLAGLLLIAWRIIERRSAQQMAGPVEVKVVVAAPGTGTPVTGQPTTASADAAKTDATVGKGQAIELTIDQEAAFKTALLSNVPEPASIPGGTNTVANDLTELIATGTSGVVTGVVNAFRQIFSSKVGYSAHGIVVAPAVKDAAAKAPGSPTAKSVKKPEDDRMWRVLVRVSDVTTGQQVNIKTVAAETPNAACREAGLWAAAVILERSTRVPSWARWSTLTADSLARYDPASRPAGSKARDEEALPDLVEAVVMAPSSGVLLQMLAEQYSLGGRYAEALMMSSRAVASHPAFMVARYRMAVSAALLCEDFKDSWVDLPISQREQVANAVRLALSAIGIESTVGSINTPAHQQERLRELAQALFARLDKDLSPLRLVRRLARRSERSSWAGGVWGVISRRGDAHRWRAITRSAALVVNRHDRNRSLPEKRLEKVERLAKRGRWWQVRYNLACYHARLAQDELAKNEGSDPEKVRGFTLMAMETLELALTEPDSANLSSRWANKDPDLRAVRNDPWFTRWLQESERPGGEE